VVGSRHLEATTESGTPPRRTLVTSRWHWQPAAVGVFVLAIVLILSAVEPSPAQAWLLGLPSPGQVISGLLGGIGSVIGVRCRRLRGLPFSIITSS
jgi:hypothetical protein